LLLELLAAELIETGPVSEVLRDVRVEHTKNDVHVLGMDPSPDNIHGRSILRIMNAAIYYLVLRARTAPNYMGTVRLDTDDGWHEIISDFEEVFDDLIAFQAQMKLTKERLKTKR
jgi:hypothetical protein